MIAGVAVIIHSFMAMQHGGPVAVPDVPAYLSVAQWINGGLLPDDLAYHPGYGVLLSPFGSLSGSHLHSIALLINGLLAGLVVLLAARLARRIGLTDHMVVFVACVAAVHPSVALSSRIAWPETLAAVLVISVALLIESHNWLASGAISTLSISVHPRLIVVAIATVLVATLAGGIKRALAGVIPALIAVLIILEITQTWPAARLEAAQALGIGPSPFGTIAGQWIALGAGTAGLAVIGVAVGCKKMFAARIDPTSSFLTLSAIGMLLLGAWVLAGSDRPDTLLYNRYMAPWAIPLSIIGLQAVWRGDLRRRTLIAISAITLLGWALIALEIENVTGPVRRIMTLDLGSIWAATDERHLLAVTLAGLLLVSCAWIFVRVPAVPMAVLAVLAVASSVVSHIQLHDVGRIADGQSTTASYLPADTTCLSHDATVKSYALWLYRLELPSVHHRRVNLSRGELPCGRYVVTTASVIGNCRDVELVAKEPRASWGLWRFPVNGCG